MKIKIQKKKNKNQKSLQIIIKKKNIKKAVTRNKIKRRIKNAIRISGTVISANNMLLVYAIEREITYFEIKISRFSQDTSKTKRLILITLVFILMQEILLKRKLF